MAEGDWREVEEGVRWGESKVGEKWASIGCYCSRLLLLDEKWITDSHRESLVGKWEHQTTKPAVVVFAVTP